MELKLKVALWDFEWVLIKRTLLRLKGVRGVSFLISISKPGYQYIRCFDLDSLVGVSSEYVRSLTTDSGSTMRVVIDKILTQQDVTMIRAIPNESTKANSSDKQTIRIKFLALSALVAPHTIALAIELGKRDELVLCTGIEVSDFRDIIDRARSTTPVRFNSSSLN